MSKNTALRLWSVALFLAILFAGAAEAAITLTPRVNVRGEIVGGEDYVYFGKYRHRLKVYTGIHEADATPVLWRVMEWRMLQTGGLGATLLSHYLVDRMEYDNDIYPYVNTWYGSEVQTWLNSSTGFLSASNFNSSERAAMYMPSPDGIAGTRVTLPSGEAYRSQGTGWQNWPYIGEIRTWFGGNDYEADKGAGVGTYTNARKAHFKGASFTYDSSNDGELYWTRTPYVDNLHPDGAWRVGRDGTLDGITVALYHVGVRPAFFLNLGSFIFKSASVFSADDAGRISNPYFLYLSAVAPKPLAGAASINGNKLTLRFTNPPVPDHPNVFHAHASGTPNPNALSSRFTLSDWTRVSAVEFKGESIELTLNKTYVPNETAPTLSYLGSTETDGIGFVNTGIVPTTLAAFSGMTLRPAPYPMLTEVIIIIKGELKVARLQPDGKTYRLSVPFGTDISDLTIDATLPSGATSDPTMPATHDFTKGPFTFKVTAGDTTEEYVIEVKAEPSAEPTEQAIINALLSGCEIVNTRNEGGTISVQLLLPFVDGFDPATIEAIRAAITGFDMLDSISFAYVDTNGSVMPISAKATDTNVERPYLQISFTAKSLDDLQKGELEKIEYWLKDDGLDYEQTFTTPLAFKDIRQTDATPSEPPSGPGPSEPDPGEPGPSEPDPSEPGKPNNGGGGGCSTFGLRMFGLLALAWGLTKRRK